MGRLDDGGIVIRRNMRMRVPGALVHSECCCVVQVEEEGTKSKEMVILGLEPRTTALLALRSTD